MEEIIIQRKENSVCICVLEKGEIVEKYEYTFENRATIGNVYLGTVAEIFDGMQAAFVELGQGKKAFLSFKDAMPKVDMVENGYLEKQEGIAKEKMSQVVQKGQKILVQIRKEAFEEKGPRVSTHITLAGNYLVLMPQTEIVTISQKIGSPEEKERLLNCVKENLPPNFGCIVRTDAEGIEAFHMIEDLKNLLNLWQKIQNDFEKKRQEEQVESPQERLLYDDNTIVKKIVRDMVRKTTKKIYVNDETIYQEVKELMKDKLEKPEETSQENLACIWEKNANFIEKFGLQTQLEKIEHRKIWLNCGAQIVIDKTEALTAIDVNTSRYIGKDDLEETIFQVNQEAAMEIMKQLRLKDIGGIIIIDFIDMHRQEHKDEILRIMREEQKKDRSKIEVKDFTQLNLVEMTRKKMHVSGSK